MSVLLYQYIQDVYVSGGNDRIHDEIGEFLKFPVKNEFHIRKYNEEKARDEGDMFQLTHWKEWDGMFAAYQNNRFPIGYLRRVIMFLIMKDVEYKVVDERPVANYIDKPFTFRGRLRDFQFEELKNALRYEYGIYNIGTGGGKTVMAVMLIAVRKVKTMIIVPTSEIQNQWIAAFHEFLPEATVGGMSRKGFIDGDVIVMTYQSLNNALHRKNVKPKTQMRYEDVKAAYNRCSMLIVDECHIAGAPTLEKIINKGQSLRFKHGLSATIDKRSDKGDYIYYGLLGDRVSVVSSIDLVEYGQTVPIDVKYHPVEYMHFDRKVPFLAAIDDESVENAYIVNNNYRNALITRLALTDAFRRDEQTLVLVRRLQHGEKLLSMMRNQMSYQEDLRKLNLRKDDIEWLHGSIKKKTRNQIVERFKQGNLKLLIAQRTILGMGFDAPTIMVVIPAAGGKAPIQTIQQCGRGVRKSKGKTMLHVHEFADQCIYTQKHAESRYYEYVDLGAKVHIEGTTLQHLM